MSATFDITHCLKKGSIESKYLEDSFADGTSLVGLVRSVRLGELAAGLHRTVVQRLEDLLVQQRSFRAEKNRNDGYTLSRL